jgi:hypothetical protein
LTRKDDTSGVPQDDTTSVTDTKSILETRTENTVGSKSCSLCGVTFQTVEDQRSHTRSDLHGYNLKQKIRGAKPVTEGEFENLVGGITALPTYAELLLTTARSR